jgi:hypothetical protein
MYTNDKRFLDFTIFLFQGVRRGRDLMIIGFTTTYESSVYHH